MRYILCFFILIQLSGCNKPNPHQLVIGAIAGPETELIETAKQVAQKKYGLELKIVTFSDYNLPNEALQDGSLDANVYQHVPYLDAAQAAHHYRFEVIGRTFVYPVGIYSKKYTALPQLPDHALIALPNDPSNEVRALQLLTQAGLITLNAHNATGLQYIATNPHNYQFKELDAAQLPRVLPDVDLAVINTTYALPAGLNPLRDALLSEDKNSPYANVIVIRQNSMKKTQLQQFVKALNSEEVKQKAHTLFGDAAIAAW